MVAGIDPSPRSNLGLSRREAGRWCGSVSLTSRSTYQLTGSAIQTEGTYAYCGIAVNGTIGRFGLLDRPLRGRGVQRMNGRRVLCEFGVSTSTIWRVLSRRSWS